MTVIPSSNTSLATLLAAVEALSSVERLAFTSMLTRPSPQQHVRFQQPLLIAADRQSEPKRRVTRLRAPTRTTAERQALYASSLWRSAYRPGIEMHIYVLGCPGLKGLARLLGEPLFKVGTAKMGRLNERMAELNRESYGSLARVPDDMRYRAEPGFDTWAPPRKLQLATPHALGPVRAATESFIVRLPADLSAGTFEADFNLALRSANLRAFIDSDEGRVLLQQRGLSPDHFLRSTSDRKTGLPAAATELMVIRPQADGPRLAALIEDIIIDRVLSTAVRAAA